MGMEVRAMIRYLRARWHARLRRIDLDILWPSLRAQASDIALARDAFMMHCFCDPAWASLGEAGIIRFVNGLE